MIDRQLLPLALLQASNDHKIRGRTRLQKMVFLIQEEFDTDQLPGEYNYIPYDYGPFAKKLYEDLDHLEERGVVKEESETIEDDKVVYFYTLGPNADEYLSNWSQDELEDVLELAETIKDRFNDIPLPDLLDYVYSEYPEYAENSVL